MGGCKECIGMVPPFQAFCMTLFFQTSQIYINSSQTIYILRVPMFSFPGTPSKKR